MGSLLEALEAREQAARGLRRRAAIAAARGSFQAAQQALTRSCGKVAGKRQVEQLTLQAAGDIHASYTTSVPQPSSDDTLLAVLRYIALTCGNGKSPEPLSLTSHSCSPRSAFGRRRAFEDEKPGRVRPDGVLLVLSVDGKGVVMRPEALREEPARPPPRAQAATRPGWPAAKSRAASGWRPWAPSTTPPPPPAGPTTS
jgi:hypothetical protein